MYGYVSSQIRFIYSRIFKNRNINMKNLTSPNVIKLHEVFEDSKNTNIVTYYTCFFIIMVLF